MYYGSIEYNEESGHIVVWIGGNAWRKKAKDLSEAGVDLNDTESVQAFSKAAAPGGSGLEDKGYERVRAELGNGGQG